MLKSEHEIMFSNTDLVIILLIIRQISAVIHNFQPQYISSSNNDLGFPL